MNTPQILMLSMLMGFVVETSLYIKHSRHDHQPILAFRPSRSYQSLDDIYRDGKGYRNLGLITTDDC